MGRLFALLFAALTISGAVLAAPAAAVDAPIGRLGEPLRVELQLHGGRAVIAGVLAALGRLEGFRLAEAGEFTRRAFLEGKLDLAQAEAVADLIDAASREAVRSALRSLSGEFSGAIGELQAGLARAGVIASPCLALAPLFYLRAVDVRAALRDLSRSGCWRDAFDRLGAVLAKAPRWLAAPQ